MKRRTILKRAAASIAMTSMVGTAAANQTADCNYPDEDPDCIIDDCTDPCPTKCCVCLC